MYIGILSLSRLFANSKISEPAFRNLLKQSVETNKACTLSPDPSTSKQNYNNGGTGSVAHQSRLRAYVAGHRTPYKKQKY